LCIAQFADFRCFENITGEKKFNFVNNVPSTLCNESNIGGESYLARKEPCVYSASTGPSSPINKKKIEIKRGNKRGLVHFIKIVHTDVV
jgi:hypothetical protein